MAIRPVGKLLVVADPPVEDNGLILPDAARGPEVGVVVRLGDDDGAFEIGDKVHYRGTAIEIFGHRDEDGAMKQTTTKLISIEQIIAVEEGDD